MAAMKITLKTLTPLWTGGVETGKMDRLHETGLIGSLRWWYEAIVRGLGGDVCDPTSDNPANRCQFDAKAYKETNNVEDGLAGVCPVCHLFGCTGWRRRFRLVIEDDHTEPLWTPPEQPLNIRPPDRNRGWFLPPGRMGILTLRFDGNKETLSMLAAIFLFLERWGSLGAKPQLGYGVFKMEQREKIARRAAAWQPMGRKEADLKLPDLRHFGFFQYRFQPQKPGWWTQTPGIERVVIRVAPLVSRHRTVPVAPALKNEWRFHHWRKEWGDEYSFFGTLQRNRIRSKVAVSWAYPQGADWEVRGHAWLQEVEIQPVWAMFCDAGLWQKILGVPGTLTGHPAAPWSAQSTAEVQKFLEATQ